MSGDVYLPTDPTSGLLTLLLKYKPYYWPIDSTTEIIILLPYWSKFNMVVMSHGYHFMTQKSSAWFAQLKLNTTFFVKTGTKTCLRFWKGYTLFMIFGLGGTPLLQCDCTLGSCAIGSAGYTNSLSYYILIHIHGLVVVSPNPQSPPEGLEGRTHKALNC